MSEKKAAEVSEKKMQLITCCGCCSLKTGTIIIGVWEIVSAVISLISISIMNVESKISIDIIAVKIVFAIGLCISILISLLLIIGAMKKNIIMMLPWVVVGIMSIVATLMSVLAFSILFFIFYEALIGVFCLIFGLIAVVIHTYMWLVVYSYLQQVRFDKMNKGMDLYEKP